MRDIKFRAWNGEKMIHNVTPWQWDFVLTTMGHKCIESNGSGPLGSGGNLAKFEVEGYSFKSIMQFTGLKDKNGKEVFQGDFLKVKRDVEGYGSTSYGGIVLVEGHTCGYSMKLISPTEEELEERWRNGDEEMIVDSSSLWHIDDAENIEIIGNIHENPGLLS